MYLLPKIKKSLPNQTGFAILPLLVLLVLGIATGTYLVQTRTNFLPKAEETKVLWDCTKAMQENGGKLDEISKKQSSCSDKQSLKFDHCDYLSADNKVTNTNTNLETCINTDSFFSTDAPTGRPNTYYCYWDPSQCPATNNKPGIARACKEDELRKDRNNPNSELKCSPGTKCLIDDLGTRTCLPDDFPGEGQPCPANITERCLPYEGDKRQCLVIGNLPKCRYPDSTENKDGKSGCKGGDLDACFSGEECWIYNDTSKGTYKYSACRKQQGAAAPAAQAPAAKPPAGGAPGAPAAQAPRAQAPAAGSQSTQKTGSFDNKISEVICPKAEDRTFCETNYKEHGLSDKKDAKCYMINGFARCKYEKNFGNCTSADAGACTQKGGCTLEKITVGNDPIQFSYCTNDAASASRGASNAGTRPASATDVICGKDVNGREIPCFQIGVFSPAELAKIEYQANLASINYAKYKEIMDQQGQKIQSQISAAQQQKINEQLAKAEEQAKACLPK